MANVTTTDLGALVPDNRNGNRGTKRGRSMVRESLRELGAGRSVLLDKNNKIIAGNKTASAAGSELDKREVIVVETTGDQLVAVKRMDLDLDLDPKAMALAIADNRAAEIGLEWDPENLRSIAADVNLGAFFTDDELNGLTEIPEVALRGNEDAVPDVPQTPTTVPGELITLGRHRLLCGDATNADDVRRLMGGKRANLVVTDPPYNIDYGNIKHPKFRVRNIRNDNMPAGDFREFCTAFAKRIDESLEGCMYVFGPPGPDGRIMFGVLDRAFHCSTTIIWNKDVFTLGRGKYQNKYEPCWFGWNSDGTRFGISRSLTNVWDVPRPKASELHPTMKPVALIELAIAHASRKGDLVLDLFGGSGTTMIACEKQQRDCAMMELDPGYCDVIVTRWETATGRKATRELPAEVPA